MAEQPEPVYDYPRTNSGPLCGAEESGYLDRAGDDVFCPFTAGPCTGGCPTNRDRACITGP